MDRVFLTKAGFRYTVSKCTLEDIAHHYSRVLAIMPDHDSDMYVDRMIQSVNEGNAYKVMEEDLLVGFMYNITLERFMEGTSIWGSEVIGMMILFRVVFEDLPKHKLMVNPYYRTYLDMRSLATRGSVRASHAVGASFAMLKEPLLKKFKDLYLKMGIEEQWQS